MDFDQIDLKKFLKAAVKVRFQGISPYDFEDFMAKLFRDNGYHVERTNYSGDFGADLILQKSETKTVVQIKRYHEGHKVGVQDVNQVLGAAKYYGGHQIMMVTTSELTQPAKELCKKAQVYYWDWQILKDAIYATYQLDDEWLYDIGQSQSEGSEEYFELSVIEVSVDEYVEDYNKPLTKVVLQLENHSEKNAHVFLDIPILLTHQNKQFNGFRWVDNYFNSGMIFNGATVEIGVYFLEEHLSEVNKGDTILLPISVPSLSYLGTLSTVLSPSDGRCFIVTFIFDKYSVEYYQAILWRDRRLMPYRWGRMIVNLYYQISPSLVWILSQLFKRQKLVPYRLKKGIANFLQQATAQIKETPLNKKAH